jgi:curved DNA-binding protein CbpA
LRYAGRRFKQPEYRDEEPHYWVYMESNTVMAEVDYYTVLGVSQGAPTSKIKKRYQALLGENPTTDAAELIKEAYAVLGSPSIRFQYDKSRRQPKKQKTVYAVEKLKPVIKNFAAPYVPKKTLEDYKDRLHIGLIIGAVMIICSIIGVNAYASHRNKVAYAAAIDKISGLNQQLIKDFKQYANPPTTTTNSQADWDAYYAGISNQIKTIASATNTTYHAAALDKFNTAVGATAADFMKLVSMSESAQNMQYQIQSDQSMVSSYQSLYEVDVSDDVICGLNASNALVACNSSLENAEKTQLAAATARLTTDQQILQRQQSQTSSLETVMRSSIAQASATARKLDP